MDSENKKNEERDNLSFEEQLAELIKQSGGSVPPKTENFEDEQTIILNNPHDEDEPIIITAPAGDGEPIMPPLTDDGEPVIVTAPADNEEPVIVTAPTDNKEPVIITAPAGDGEPIITPLADDEPIIVAPPVDDEPIITAPTKEQVSAEEQPPTQNFNEFGDGYEKPQISEQLEAELDAIINGFSDGDDTGFMDFGEPDFSVENKEKSEDDGLHEINSEIAELEKDINEAEIAHLQQKLEEQEKRARAEKEQTAESYRLDYELERMLNSFEDKRQPEPQQAQNQQSAQEVNPQPQFTQEPPPQPQPQPAPNPQPAETVQTPPPIVNVHVPPQVYNTQSDAVLYAKLDELLKESREKDAKIEELLKAEKASKEEKAQLEMQQMLDKIASLENTLAQKEKPQESAAVIADENIEIVPPQKERDIQASAEAEKVAAMEAKLDELLNAKKEPTPDPAAVTEMEQMRAKIASLEYMLSQKSKESEPVQSPTATGIPTGDINTMFKQWFDLEMAAKMKTLILPEDKKAAEAAQQSAADDANQSSDFIKLSDNVFYNVKEKKTYVMKELSPTPSLPAARPKKKPVKPVKHKPAAKKKSLPRKKKRPQAHSRALRPRRPKPPARRPKR